MCLRWTARRHRVPLPPRKSWRCWSGPSTRLWARGATRAHDHRAVVEQALAGDDDGQAAGRADLPEDGQHGDRLGGGDDGAEEEGVDPGQTGREVERCADESGGGDDAGQGEQGDGRALGPQVGQVEVVGAVAEQYR